MPPLLALPIDETPIAVIDFETTGCLPGSDRVVEVAVVRVDPGQAPRLVLDTLVNPRRKMAATEIHEITDADVADAPTFDDIADDLLEVLGGCAVAAYNVYFDMGFLNYELERVGKLKRLPHLCLMYLRPMLKIGPRLSLADACREHQINGGGMHHAAGDAIPSAELYRIYQQVCREKGIKTFSDLMAQKSYKFCGSFALEPCLITTGGRWTRHKQRRHAMPSELAPPTRTYHRTPVEPDVAVHKKSLALREYWEVLKLVIADLDVTDDEIDYVDRKRSELNLSIEHVRAQHARAFASVIAQFTDDKRIDDREREKLRRLKWALHRLGWAPGD